MRWHLALGALASLAFASVSHAQSIDTVGDYSYSWSPFGDPDTTAYGQTFTVGSPNVLNSFSLFLDGPVANPVDFTAQIYAWNGSSATGTALWSSALQSFSGSPSGAPVEFTFDTGGLALTAGSQFVAFLLADHNGLPSTARMPASSGYAGGSFVYQNNGGDYSDLTTSYWTVTGDDVWFRANFGDQVAAVPEPGTWATMLLGFGAAGFAMRRQRRKLLVQVA